MSDSTTTLGPGLHAGIPAKQYHAMNLCSASRLRTLSNLTPLHLRHELDSGEERASLEMRMGTALHTLVLEGDEAFAAQYAIGGPINEATGKPFGSATNKFAEWQSQQMLKRGVVDCFNHYDGEAIRRMANAIWAHEDAARFLRACRERELTVVGELHGTMCKGRIDGYGVLDGEEIVIDLKTTSRETSPTAFERVIAEKGYDIQASMYEHLLFAHQRPVKHTIFIAAESEPPYAVACYRMRNDTLTLMEQYLPLLIEQYTACDRGNDWPGWGTHEVGLPGWRVQQINRVLGVEVSR